MTTPALKIYSYVLEKAEDDTAAKRAELYRALAAVIGDPRKARELNQIADELEQINRRCRQLTLGL